MTAKNPITDIFNCQNIDKFIDSIVQMMRMGGYSGGQFFTCMIEEHSYLVKLSLYYKNYGEFSRAYGRGKPEMVEDAPDGLMNSFDSEIKILNILKNKIINQNLSSCILELLDYQICEGIEALTPSEKKCDNLMTENIRPSRYKDRVNLLFCQFKDLIAQGIAYNKISYLIMETYDMTFGAFLENHINSSPIHVEIFRSLIFQLIYTFYTIKRIYPKFYHGDLHVNNVMLLFDDLFKYVPSDAKYLKFWINNKPYYLPYFGIVIKVIDYGFSGIPEEGIVPYIRYDKFINTIRYFENDFLFFFSDIRKGFNIPSINKMIEELDPGMFSVVFNPEFIRRNSDRVLSELQMLETRTFKDYRENVAREDQILQEFANVEKLVT